MESGILTLDDLDFRDRTVILRLDINSPIDHRTGQLADDNRVRKSVPTIRELASIIENTWKNGNLFIDALFDPKQENCWTGNMHGPSKAWKINFHLGYIVDTDLLNRNSVRGVRLKMTLPE